MMNKTYCELIKNYPTSEALIAYLRSAEGGYLVVRDDMMSPDDPLVVIRYEKGLSNLSLPHVESFRSVVWDVRANMPVAASPSRGLKFGTAANTIMTSFVVEEFVDGVMINLFWDHNMKKWRIATRTHLDAGCNFYGTRTFAELFWETFNGMGLHLEHLSQTYTYSWVLQHPEERVVVPTLYNVPKLRLVEMSMISNDGTHVVLREDPGALLTSVYQALLPERHELRTLEDVKERVEAWGHRFGSQWQGLVIKNTDAGQPRRWKLRSNEYDEARHLRGNQANLPYTWLTLWSAGKLKQYTKLYPEEIWHIQRVVDNFKACTQELHNLYQQVYKNRTLPLGQAPQKYRKLLWDAHTAKKGAYFPDLRDFMNSQDTARKLWLVNYESRYPMVSS